MVYLLTFSLRLKMRQFSKIFNFFLLLNLLLFYKHGKADGILNGYHGEERDALLAFKSRFEKSFLDRNWTGIMCYENVHPYWYGIECSKGRVTGIRLESLGLTGKFPRSDVVFNLTQLSVISLRNNSISENIIDFSNNQKLIEIDLSSNNFVGPIPSSLATLNSLASLQLQDNNLSGSIPLFNHSSLKQFNVSNNNLSGAVPNTSVLQSLDARSFFGNQNLCGPPTSTSCNRESDNKSIATNASVHPGKSKPRYLLILLVVFIFILGIFLLFSMFYFKKCRNLKKQLKAKYILHGDVEKKEEKSTERVSEKGVVEGDVEDKGKLVFVTGKQNFEVDDLLKAKAESLGQGNFGNCYKVMIEEGTSLVVKRLRNLKAMTREEYMKQVNRIAEQNHPNLLPLIAFYYSKEEKLLLHKFASNGNAFTRLHSGKGSPARIPFRWSSRLAVARGVARGLEYLHLNTTPPHGNLKLSNVLLDENDAVLLTDYGLNSLIASPIAEHRMVAYKSPEFRTNKKLSKKSDVWSYGCLLLELLTGKISADSAPQGARNAVDICNWVHRAVREEWTGEVFDVEIAVQRSANHAMVRLLQIAIRCCDLSPEKRPDMSIIIGEVERIVAVTDSGSEEDLAVSGDRSLSMSVTDDSFVGGTSSFVGTLSMISGENHG